MKKLSSLAFLIMLVQLMQAQSTDAFFRSNQKFYVVVAVLLIIFVGIISFLFGVERRLKKLENS